MENVLLYDVLPVIAVGSTLSEMTVERYVSSNASFPMLITLLGIVTEVRLEQ